MVRWGEKRKRGGEEEKEEEEEDDLRAKQPSLPFLPPGFLVYGSHMFVSISNLVRNLYLQYARQEREKEKPWSLNRVCVLRLYLDMVTLNSKPRF